MVAKALVVGLGLLCFSCAPKDKGIQPVWLGRLVADFQKQELTNPPRSVWLYRYNGQAVYYLPPVCCDQFGVLYDAEGTVLCAPDGGLTGRGDGRCPDFAEARKDERLVWKDDR